jgi:hypothetical protein
MSCQRSGLTQPHTVLATLATLPFLFSAHAWAAPHSPLVRRDSSVGMSGSSRIVVCPSIADHSTLLTSYPTPRLPLSLLSFSLSVFPCWPLGARFCRSSGTCSCDGVRPRVRLSETSPQRRSLGRLRQTRPMLPQPPARSDGPGAPGAPLVKFRHARYRYT